jgi:cyclopropane-fatty-acyl-phospholipid synthase
MYLNSDSHTDPRPAAESDSALRPVTRSAGSWLINRALACIKRGQITIILPSGERIAHSGQASGSAGMLEVHSLRTFYRLLTRGDLGFAEGYMAGDWTSPDLPSLLAVLAENVAHFDRIDGGFWPVQLWRRVAHALKRNSAKGSRRNIAFHYDLGNDFYQLWLDDSMSYSSAIAVEPGQSLEQAQRARLGQIAKLLHPDKSADVLEIGFGWGGLATTLAPHFRTITGLTLSTEQLAFAQQRVAAEGFAETIDLRLQDYRAVTGQFDRIVSIEMLEAVGEAYWPTYFAKLAECLKPGGRIVLQAITIHPDRYAAYKRKPDFIQHYVFPGGMLPTPDIMTAQAARAGLQITATQTFAAGYAATLAAWRARFLQAWPEVAKLGFDERFRRLWDYYLSYCEAGFRIGTIDVGLYVLAHEAA